MMMLQFCRKFSYSFHLKRSYNHDYYHNKLSIIRCRLHHATTTINNDDTNDGDGCNNIHHHQPKSLVICGPSGVGKGTLINKLLVTNPQQFSLSVSYTSRKPRQHEVDGKHYHFVDKEFLMNDIKYGSIKYVEYAEVHSNIYGTRQDDIDAIHQENKICILDIDCNGVKQLKRNQFSAIYVFIRPVSISVLENRLRSRNTESESQIQLRLHNARNEIDYGDKEGNFDYILINDQLDDSFMILNEKIKAWFPKVFESNLLLNNNHGS
jgi:guanylate kinase